MKNGQQPKQLSKEFVRQWLMENGFSGQEGQKIPEMTPEVVNGISERYIELYESVTDKKFVKEDITDLEKRIETNVQSFLDVYLYR